MGTKILFIGNFIHETIVYKNKDVLMIICKLFLISSYVRLTFLSKTRTLQSDPKFLSGNRL